MDNLKVKIYLAALKSLETAEDSAWTTEEDDLEADIFRDCSVDDFCIDDDIIPDCSIDDFCIDDDIIPDCSTDDFCCVDDI